MRPPAASTRPPGKLETQFANPRTGSNPDDSMMRNVATLVMGGGRGTRLYPLTKYRAKPAVPVAGKYRLIDIPLSNCINSGLNRVHVLTQFMSVSLHRHITQTYKFDHFADGFVEILAAQQTYGDDERLDWYQGTADAVRKNIRYIEQPGIDLVLILSGDQLYRMNYGEMIASHQQSKADVTIATIPVDRKEATASGIMLVNEEGRVTGFLEKPQTDQELAHVRTDPAWIDARGIKSQGRQWLASMGIYLFSRETLVEALRKTDYKDFGREIFPAAIRSRRVHMYLFDDYWEDIGTIRSFYEANLALARSDSPFSLVSSGSPLYTRPRFLPPTRIDGARVVDSLIADGCFIEPDVTIENSVIGLRCRVGRGATIRNSVIMGADYYEGDVPTGAEPIEMEPAAAAIRPRPPLGIGRGTLIEGAIVDKNCRIGTSCRVVNDLGIDQTEADLPVSVHEGVVVVEKDAVLPDGWRFERQ
jgi:glucose-1-phosphate adenylyltransferase